MFKGASMFSRPQFRPAFVAAALLLGTLGMTACGGGATPTPAPTAPPPTIAAKTAPTTGASTSETQPAAALANFKNAKAYKLNAKSEVSKLFFQAPVNPAEGS